MVFSTSAKWAKIVATDLGHLGITFGRFDTEVYAYSYHSGSLKVSRIDDSGAAPNILWTYSFAGTASKTIIGHKAFDISTDILVITGVASSADTYFGVMIMPVTPSPFTPTSTNIYYSSFLNSYIIRGIYIVSPTVIKFLVYITQQSHLLTLNLSGLI